MIQATGSESNLHYIKNEKGCLPNDPFQFTITCMNGLYEKFPHFQLFHPHPFVNITDLTPLLFPSNFFLRN
jgi:hypothetical protein